MRAIIQFLLILEVLYLIAGLIRFHHKGDKRTKKEQVRLLIEGGEFKFFYRILFIIIIGVAMRILTLIPVLGWLILILRFVRRIKSK